MTPKAAKPVGTTKPLNVMDKLKDFRPSDHAAGEPGILATASTEKSKTAPGQLLEFMLAESEIGKRNKVLEEQAKMFDHAHVTKLLPAESVIRSKWANRHENSFDTSDFKKLKSEIESAGINIQAIKVRPSLEEEGRFEIIFGHRRHQACLELGLPVLATIVPMDDRQLFSEMDRENRQRADLRPYEQGLIYRRALDEGLFNSAKIMANSLGVSMSAISRALTLARLPSRIIAAFDNPLDLQFRWADVLSERLEKDPSGVLAIADEISALTIKPSSKEVFARLCSPANENKEPSSEKTVITSTSYTSGRITVSPKDKSILIENIEDKRFAELQAIIDKFMASNIN